MTKTVEIYFDDQKPEAQEHRLMTWDTTKDDENWDTVPLAVIEREVENPYWSEVEIILTQDNDKYSTLSFHLFLGRTQFPPWKPL
jgi:hypothetical protein